MDIKLVEKIYKLYDELTSLESERHGIWKAMLPEDVTHQRVAEYDARIAEIRAELDAL